MNIITKEKELQELKQKLINNINITNNLLVVNKNKKDMLNILNSKMVLLNDALNKVNKALSSLQKIRLELY